MTGYSPAQVTRLIAQYRRTGHVKLPVYRRHRFPVQYTREDQALLAEVDNAHDRLSGAATQAVLRRECTVFGRKEFERLRKGMGSQLESWGSGQSQETARSFQLRWDRQFFDGVGSVPLTRGADEILRIKI